ASGMTIRGARPNWARNSIFPMLDFRRGALASRREKSMRTEWIVLAVLGAIVLVVIVLFNRLVRQRNMVREGWSGIDVQLKRRTDLVPNLVETVKGYAGHERGVFDDVAKTRASSIAADNVTGQAAAERALQTSLGKLFAIAES